jgi:predicted RNA-binding Zn-ribbon protein involved in translation (DUF1610 family)
MTTGRKDASDELARRIGVKAPEGGGKPADPLEDLEAAINKIDSMEAKDMLRTKARVLRANLELQAQQAEERLRKGDNNGGSGSGEAKGIENETIRDRIAANAIALLEKGVPANVVGQYLTGSNAGTIPIGAGGQQGLTMADVTSIFQLAKTEKGTDPELKAILARMDERLANVEKERNNVPKEAPKAKIYRFEGGKWIKEELEPGEAMMIPPPPPGNTGKSVDEIKEEHRHEEEMAKLNETKEYHQSIAGTMSDIVPRIGAGIAASMKEGGEEGSENAPPAASKKMEYYHCTGKLPDSDKDCGYNIPVPPTALKITCPKCGTIYGRETK